MSDKVSGENTGRGRTRRRARGARMAVLVAAALALPVLAIGLMNLRAAPEPPDREASRRQAGDAEQPQHEHTNHLIHETSPYLLMHAHNPVDWYPWGEEAFEKAEREDKPIFLSVGYSTCYWCQVMERESFTNEQIAQVLNEHYVSIKVDREERPDIDEQYMLATQLLTGGGGWPNSVWLTPDGRPWMAGTYFPPQAFRQGLLQLADVWKNRREDVERQADRLADAIRRVGSGQGGADAAQAAPPLNRALVDEAVRQLGRSFDSQNGGFGAAPKFPPHGPLGLLLREYRRSGNEQLLEMATRTLDAMALGGMHDHIGGGFHRYATDGQWFRPHFEKMLYDNAQLMRSYAEAHALTGRPLYREVVEDIFAWLQRQMTGDHGAFYSAIDSEIDGEEGESYLWHYNEIVEALGEEDAALFVEVYNIEKRGNYTEEATGERTGTNIVYLTAPLEEIATGRGAEPQRFKRDLASLRRKLLEVQNTWPQPETDDKVLTAWNGLMIEALAYAGRRLDERSYVEAAKRAAEFIQTRMLRDGELLRTYRAGEAKQPAYLDDYAYLAAGMIELHEATGDSRWLEQAQRLADTMLEDFEDRNGGGFFFTSGAHEDLILRSKGLTGGGNVPTPNGTAARVLLRLGELTAQKRYAEAAERTLKSLTGIMASSPRAVDGLIIAAAMHLPPEAEPAGSERASTAVAAASAPQDSQSTPSLPSADARRSASAVTARLYASRLSARPGQTVHVAVALDIEEGWHLYGPNPEVQAVVPTTVKLRTHESVEPGEVVTPEGRVKHDPVLEEEMSTYEGRIWFRVPVTVRADASAGAVALELELRTQACDASRCLLPQTTLLRLPLSIDPEADPADIRHEAVFRSLGVEL